MKSYISCVVGGVILKSFLWIMEISIFLYGLSSVIDKIFVQLRNTFEVGGSKSRAVLFYYLYMSKFV